MKKLGLLFSLIVTSVTGALCAATPGWTGVPMSASGDTIVAEGELVYAVAGGHTDGNSLGEITVNGVTFTTIKSLTDYPSSKYTLPFTVSPKIQYDAAGLGNHGTTGDYAQMLEKGFWSSAVGEYTFTLNGLEAGNTYLVQIVCHRDTTGYTVVAPDGVASIQTGKGDWTYGGSLVGVFNATGTSYTFTINYTSSDGGSKAHFNAFQVRKLSGAEPTPVDPSIGSVSKSVKGSAATITLADVVKGTDDECVDATSYSVWYSLTNAPAVEALTGQDGSSAAFTLNDLADGHYTCSVTISNDVGKVSAAKSVEFDVNVSGLLVLGWTAEPMDKDGNTIRTDGTLLYAYGQAWPTKTTYTVNTVPFSADDGIYGGKCSTTIGYRADSTPPSDVSGDYASLLQYGWWGNAGDQSFTLNNLTAGKNYLVQIVIRHLELGECATAPDGTVAKSHGTGWEYGGSLVYVFAATGSSESIVINYSGTGNGARAYFNAIQVREVENVQPPAPVPVEPSIGSISKSVNGSSATITLSDVVMGTDDECVDATSYSVWYSLASAPAVEALAGQTGSSAAFMLNDLADGHYTCEVTISNDVGVVSAAKSVEFTIDTSSPVLGDWAMVKAALESASYGDTIELPAGVYHADELLSVGQKVKIVGAGKGKTIIDGDNSCGAFNINKENVKISGITFRNCLNATDFGGAISANREYHGLEVTDCSFANCTAVGGGAIGGNPYYGDYGAESGELPARGELGVVSGCDFTDCAATGTSSGDRQGGGAIEGPFWIENSSFRSCTAATLASAVFANQHLMITNCTFEGCASPTANTKRGVIWEGNPNAVLAIADCTFTGITADPILGKENSAVLVERCVFDDCAGETATTSDNECHQLFFNGKGTARNCLFKNGKNPFVLSYETFENCTFVNNTGALFVHYDGNPQVAASLVNCVFANNDAWANDAYGKGGAGLSWHNANESDVPDKIAVANTVIAAGSVSDSLAALLARDASGMSEKLTAEANKGGLFAADGVTPSEGSPLVGTGKVEDWMKTTTDLAGNARMNGFFVDLGCCQTTFEPWLEPSSSPAEDVAAGARFHSFCGVPSDDLSGDVGEWIVLTNISGKALDLQGVRVELRKAKEAVAACSFRIRGRTLPANGSVRLNQSDFAAIGWTKISNGDLELALYGFDGDVIQKSAVSKSVNISGALAVATAFGAETSATDWTAVPAASADPVDAALAVSEVVNAGDATLVDALRLDLSKVGAGKVVMAWGGMNRGDDPANWLGFVDLGEVAAGDTELLAKAPAGYSLTDSTYGLVKFFFSSDDGATWSAVSPAFGMEGKDWLKSGDVRQCGAVVINEFVAKNSEGWIGAEGIKDKRGAIPGETVTNRYDWIELKNESGVSVDLSGWGVSDKASKPFKCVIPSGVVLGNGEFLMITCDGTTGYCAAGEVHLDLSLSTDAGEYLSLTDPSGRKVCEITYPQQVKDASYGRDGTGAYAYFREPTPKSENNTKTYTAPTPKVAFSEPHGWKTASFDLTLTCDDPSAEIRYTTDGGRPGRSSTKYTGAIPVSKTTVIRAVALTEGDSILVQENSASYLYAEDILKIGDTSVPSGFPASKSIEGKYASAPTGIPGASRRQVFVYGFADIADADARERMLRGLTNSIETVSIVIDPKDLFDADTGIYVNARADGSTGASAGMNWERQMMLEQFDPRGTRDGYTIPAGLKIRGASSRDADHPKHAFHVIFRSQYGAGSLDYPLFGDEGADSFERFDLRCSQNYAFANGSDFDTFITEVFTRDAQRDLGEPYHRSRYYNLFINGVYWGIYQSEERMCQDFAATYNGAEPEDYDIVRTDVDQESYQNSVVDGDDRAHESNIALMGPWCRLWFAAEREGGFASKASYNFVRGLDPNGSRNPEYQVLVNVTNTITYMMLSHFVGDTDCPAGSGTNHVNPNNNSGFRCREDGKGLRDGFMFTRHDGEHGLGFGYGGTEALYSSLVSYKDINTILAGTTDLAAKTGESDYLRFNGRPNFGTAELHARLMENPEYKMLAADLVYRHVLKKGGAMTAEAAEARYRSRMAELEDAIELEISRWRRPTGDKRPNSHALWEYACQTNLEFIANRAPYYIAQLREVGWYPSIDAPEVAVAADGKSATLSSKDAGVEIYYTTDGSDPRLEGGAVSASAEVYTDAIPVAKTGMKIKARARSASGEWSALQEEGLKASSDDGYTFYYTGDHEGDIVIDASVWPDVTNECTVIFDNANVNGKLVLANDIRVALVLSNDTVNTIKTIEGPGAHLRLAGADGELKLEGAGTLVSVSNLVVKSGTLSVKTTEIAAEDKGNKTKVIEVLGHVKQTGGVIDVDIELESEDQICGIYLKNKDLKDSKDNNLGIIYAEFSGGEFKAKVGGTKSAAIFVNKGSVDTKFIGEFETDVTLVGPQARFVSSAGDIKLQGGEITVTGEESATDARVFKSDKKINIKGGEYWINAVGQNSEIFSTSVDTEDPKTSSITITDGRFHLVAADDCFSADNLIQIDGGLIYAKSLYDDVFDSNGDMVINGGTILAYTTADGHEAFDVDPVLTGSYGSSTLTVNGGTIFATGGKNAAWPAKTVKGTGVTVFAAAEVSAATYSEKYLSLAGSGSVTYTAKLPAMSGKCAIFATCPGFGGTPLLSDTKPASGDMEFHDLYVVEEQASNQEYLRVYEVYGSTTGDGDTDEYVVLVNMSENAVQLQGFRFTSAKDDGKSAPKVNLTLGAGEVAPYGSVTLRQADYASSGWAKITNGKIVMTLVNSKGETVQTARADFGLFEDTDGKGASLIAKRFDNKTPLAATTDDWRSSSSEPPAPPAEDPEAPVIGGGDIIDPIVVTSDKVTIKISNAGLGFTYGYKKSVTLEGLATAEPVWLAAPATDEGVLAIEIAKDPSEPSCFYQIVVK